VELELLFPDIGSYTLKILFTNVQKQNEMK